MKTLWFNLRLWLADVLLASGFAALAVGLMPFVGGGWGEDEEDGGGEIDWSNDEIDWSNIDGFDDFNPPRQDPSTFNPEGVKLGEDRDLTNAELMWNLFSPYQDNRGQGGLHPSAVLSSWSPVVDPLTPEERRRIAARWGGDEIGGQYNPAANPTLNPSMMDGLLTGADPRRRAQDLANSQSDFANRAALRMNPNAGQVVSPTRGLKPMAELQRDILNRGSSFHSWDGNGGPTEKNGGNLAAAALEANNKAKRDARNQAMADRNQALGAAYGHRRLVQQRLGSNPFGPEYQAQAIGVLRDARARQYNAAVTQLQQQYAAAGRQLDPRLLLVLRQQMATEENADLRESMMDTATKRFGADQSYVNQMGDTVSALDRILSNTQLQPDPSELAFLQSLYRNSGGFYGRKMG